MSKAKKVKIKIHFDGKKGRYEVDPVFGREVEVPKSRADYYSQTIKKFEVVQAELKKLAE